MNAATLSLPITTVGGAAVVRPVGRLDLSTYAGFRDTLVKYAADEPTALVVRLGSDFECSSTSELSVLATVWMRVSEWPGVPVLVVAECARHLDALRVSGVARFVSTFPDLRAALDAVHRPRARRRHEMRLPLSLGSPRAARRFVRDTCARWALESVVDDAVLVTSELVENAVRHTGSAPVLRLELRRGQLAIAVSDDEARPPQPRPLTSRVPGGRGLPLVAAMSRAWGWSPSPHGGKVVWAVLAVPVSGKAVPDDQRPAE